MTSTEFQEIFSTLHQKIIDLIESQVDASTPVKSRDVSDDENRSLWLGRIKDDNGKIHCWTVEYIGCGFKDDSSEGVPVGCSVYVPVFRIIGYHYYDFGTDAQNSTKTFLDELNNIRFAFEEAYTLNFDDWVTSHSGFADRTILTRIDTQRVHISRIDLSVQLLPVS